MKLFIKHNVNKRKKNILFILTCVANCDKEKS